MKIELNEITIRDVASGYVNSDENGVIGFGGKLNIRPKFQREFVYSDIQRNSVIDTIRKGFPLNVMYWIRNEDDTYELLDGQQRTISICEYISGAFSINYQYFHSLQQDEKEQILNYKLMIYICEGTDSEKLNWFKTINIAGERLFDQELRNAIYIGEWLTDAKRYFSKTCCAAYQIGNKYLSGTAIRQDYLQTAIKWISKNHIEDYMSKHQHDPNASELWLYFTQVINWVVVIFPIYRREMKGVEWGFLYNKYKDELLDANNLEKIICKLMMDDDVTNKTGIYTYVLTNDEKHLNIRAFTPNMKREAFERQNGICNICHNPFKLEDMEGDHIIPWHSGGKTTSENCQMLCKKCNREKSGK